MATTKIPQNINDHPGVRYLEKYVIGKVCAAGANKWQDLGMKLLGKDAAYVLDTIKAKNNDIVEECCKRMFTEWCRRTRKTSWKQLIEALKEVKLTQLASKLEELLQPGELYLSEKPSAKMTSELEELLIPAELYWAEDQGAFMTSEQQQSPKSRKLLFKGSDRPTLKHLYKHVVKHAAYKWRDLGVQLLEDNQIIMLDMIATNHPLDIAICCKVFMKWLETRVDASWNQLIRALRSPTVQLISLADQLEQMMSTESSVMGTSGNLDYGSSSSDSMKVRQSVMGTTSGSSSLGYGSSSSDSMKENLTCPVCYRFYKSPKFLSCHHSYCEACLEKLQVDSKIICPECRYETIVPPGGAKELIANFFINRIMDKLGLKRKERDKELKCDDCSETEPVVAYCVDCKSNLCQICCENHKRSKIFRSHGIVSLINQRSNKNVTIQPEAMALMCKEHDLELLLYCETCEQLVCKHCVAKGHHGHDYTNARMKICKCQIELEEVTTSGAEVVKNLSEAQDTTDKMKKKEGSLATEKNFILSHVIPVDGPHQIECDGQSGGCFIWNDRGLEISFPPKCSQQHVQVATSTFLPIKNEVHRGMHIVSAVYQFDCNIQRFDKAFTLRLQHCVKLQSPEDCQKMRFVIQHDDSNDMKYGCFEAGKSYGTVKLNRFCHIYIIWIHEQRKYIRVVVLPLSDDKDNSSSSSSQQSNSGSYSVEPSTLQTDQRGNSQSSDDQQSSDSSVPVNTDVVDSDDSPPYEYEAMFCLPKDHCESLNWRGVYSIYSILGEWRLVSKDSIHKEGVTFPVNVYVGKINFDAGGIAKLTCEKTSENIVDVHCWPNEIKKEDVDNRVEDHKQMCTKYSYSSRSTDILYSIVRKSVIEVRKTGGTPSSNCPLIIKGIKPHQQVDLCTDCCTNLKFDGTIDSQSTTNVNAGPVPSVSTTQQSHVYENINYSPRLGQSGILETRPEMRDLIIGVIPLLEADWEDVAYLLYYNDTKIDSIKGSHNGDPYKCCRELLKDWLETSRGVFPKHWGVLLNSIAESENFTKKAEDIIKYLEKKITG